MTYPLQIFTEPELTGLRLELWDFSNSQTYLWSENVLLISLDDTLSLKNQSCVENYNIASMLFLSSNVPVTLLGNHSKALLCFFTDQALENRQKHIQLDSHLCIFDTAYQPLLNAIYTLIDTLNQKQIATTRLQKIQSLNIIEILLKHFCQTTINPAAQKQYDKIPQEFINVLHFVDLNYRENLQLKDIAKQFFYTSSHLSKLFVKYTGMLFSEYLNHIRLNKAMPLLLQSSLDIQRISDFCGFTNSRAFQQIFQKKYHEKPSVYRKLYTHSDVVDDSPNDQDFIKQILKPFQQKIQQFQKSLGTNLLLPNITYKNVGNIAFQKEPIKSMPNPNTVLNIDFTRDLIFPEMQNKIKKIVKKFSYKYITLNCFLADDMQVYFPDVINSDFSIKPRETRRYRYDFSLYDQIFNFISTLDLIPIIGLSFIPSFLAKDSFSYDSVFHSCLCLPYSMQEWKEYIQKLFNHLNKRYFEIMKRSLIYIWNVPDVFFINNKLNMTESDYFSFYKETSQIIREIIPNVSIGSPTISLTQEGIDFTKRFLNYCIDNQCVPKIFFFIYYDNQTAGFTHINHFLDLKYFLETLNKYLKSSLPKYKIQKCLLEYAPAFGGSAYSDGLVGAMLPILMTLNEKHTFDIMGISNTLDWTTRHDFGHRQFRNSLAILTPLGGKKAAYYSFKFLNALHTQILHNVPGCCISKNNNSLTLLLYHNIPIHQWTMAYSEKNLPDFYNGFNHLRYTIELSELPNDCYLIKEQYLNHEKGSAYEQWVFDGWALQDIDTTHDYGEMTDLDEPIYTSFPQINIKKVQIQNGKYHYSCTLKPFEFRLVEFIPQ